MFNPLGLIGAIFLPLGALMVLAGIITAVATGEWLFLLAFGSSGLPFLIVGIVFICIVSAKKRKKARLLENGRRIYTRFNTVDYNYAVRINYAHPRIVLSSYEDPSGKIYMFKSENLKFDPTEYLQGKQIPVYVDGDNFKKYYMDLDSVLPEICVY